MNLLAPPLPIHLVLHLGQVQNLIAFASQYRNLLLLLKPQAYCIFSFPWFS